MTPVKQTVLYSKDAIGNGNCMAACLASILGLPLWMVPPFEQMFGREDWNARVNEWLAQFFGLQMVRGGESDAQPGEFYLANGLSPRGVYHSTVYQDGKLVHDPHFSDAGIANVEWVWRLVPVHPNGRSAP